MMFHHFREGEETYGIAADAAGVSNVCHLHKDIPVLLVHTTINFSKYICNDKDVWLAPGRWLSAGQGCYHVGRKHLSSCNLDVLTFFFT